MYGKDKSALSKVGSFRQQGKALLRNQREARPSSGGSRRIPYWVNQFKPPTHTVATGRILAGNYEVLQVDAETGEVVAVELPYFTFTEHYYARTKKGGICSAGPFQAFKDKRDPCLGCDLFFEGMELDPETNKRRPGPMGKRDMFAFNWLDLGTFYHIPQTDKNGAVRRNNNGEPYMTWVKGKKGGNDPKYPGADTKVGHLQQWAMGFGHYSSLLAADAQIGRSCLSCGTRDSIESLAWVCANCGEPFIELESTQLDEAGIEALVTKPCTCPACKHEGYPQEYVECSACDSPQKATIFDVTINVQRIASADGSNQTSLSVSNWSAPGPLPPEFADVKPLELDKIFAPTPIDEQAELWNVSTSKRQPVTGAEDY